MTTMTSSPMPSGVEHNRPARKFGGDDVARDPHPSGPARGRRGRGLTPVPVMEPLEGRALFAAGTIDSGIVPWLIPRVNAVGTPTPTPTGPAVTGLTLINAATDQAIGPLTSGSTIDEAAVGNQLSVLATTSPTTVGSVLFVLDGVLVRTENTAAYAIAGDDGAGDFNPLTPGLANGTHTLTVTAFSAANGGGDAGQAVTVQFSVTGATTTPTPTPTPTTPTPTPTPSGTNITVNKQFVVFNAVRGSSQGGIGLTIQNKGSSTLNLSGLSISGGDAGQFSIGGGGGAGSIAPGGTRSVTLSYSAPSGTSLGIHTSTLVIASDDPSAPQLSVPLRALATQGTGGQNEPSLQRIFDLYQLGLNTGDANPGNTNLYSAAEPLTASSEEVVLQKLVKAGSGNVTITPLAAFAGGNPVVKFGYYDAGNASGLHQLLTVPSADAQTVNPSVSGSTSFDPGSGAFGIYANFPIFNNTAYSEDKLNTTETVGADRRKVRFYPLKQNGSVVPNAFVFTSEDFINDPTGSYDTNDFIGIIRNVSPTGSGLSVQNLDGVPSNDRMVFSRIENPDGEMVNETKRPAFITPESPATFKTVEALPAKVKDTGTFRLTNSGSQPITITSLQLTNPVWTFVNRPADGAVVQPGQFVDVVLKFVAHGLRPGHSGNETIDKTGRAASRGGSHLGTLVINSTDPTTPSRTLTLAGWWQKDFMDPEEPNLDTTVTKLFGYSTSTLPSGKVTLDGLPTAVGDEVLSAYWKRADSGQPVTVRQLISYHGIAPLAADPEIFATPTDAAQLQYFLKGNKTGPKILNHDPDQAQTVLPQLAGAPSGGSFSTGSVFGFHVTGPGNEWSDDSLNARDANQPTTDMGHHMRFFPVKDASGNVVPNTYIMGMDYAAINYDFQDNVYLISNITPAS